LVELSTNVEFFEADTFDGAVRIAAISGGIDLALLGQTMPGMNGVVGARVFRDTFPDGKLVLLTAALDSAMIIAAVAAGVDGIIPKTSSGQGMIHALRLVLSGMTYLPADMVVAIASLAILSTAVDELASAQKITWTELSDAENLVVPLLLDGLASKIIAERLGIDESAVKARLRSVYKKLRVNNVSGAKARAFSGRSEWRPIPRGTAPA